MKFIIATLFLIELFCACDATPLPGTTELELNVGSPLCFKPGGDPLAVMPQYAAYPLGGQHVWCQHMVGETNSWQWPSWASPCFSTPGLHQLQVYVSNTGGSPTTFCTQVNVPFASTPSLSSTYVETMELGWLSSTNARHISHVTLGRGTGFIMSSLQNVATSGCTPASACVSSGVSQIGSSVDVSIDSLLTTSSWKMGTVGMPTCVAAPGHTLDPPVACPGFVHCMSCFERGPNFGGTVAACVSSSVNAICAAHCSECYEPA